MMDLEDFLNVELKAENLHKWQTLFIIAPKIIYPFKFPIVHCCDDDHPGNKVTPWRGRHRDLEAAVNKSDTRGLGDETELTMVCITGHRRRLGVIIQPREASQERSGSQTKHNPWGGLQFYNRFKRVLDFPFFCVSYDMIYVNLLF